MRVTTSNQRGSDVAFYLVSAQQTRIKLTPAFPASLDWAYDSWPFLAVGFWGEQADGTWSLIVTNEAATIRYNLL